MPYRDRASSTPFEAGSPNPSQTNIAKTKTPTVMRMQIISSVRGNLEPGWLSRNHTVTRDQALTSLLSLTQERAATGHRASMRRNQTMSSPRDMKAVPGSQRHTSNLLCTQDRTSTLSLKWCCDSRRTRTVSFPAFPPRPAPNRFPRTPMSRRHRASPIQAEGGSTDALVAQRRPTRTTQTLSPLRQNLARSRYPHDHP